ncbi:MAG: phage major tail tube protein [Paenisporosarcina sp.]
MVNPIPEKVVAYNVYDDQEKLVGISEEVTLPTVEFMTETISGAGIAGEYESANLGHTSSMTIEIPFRTLFEPSFRLMRPGGRTITLRASQQSYDVAAGKIQSRPLKVTLKVIPKAIELGKLAAGKMTETKNTLEVVYIKIEENSRVVLEIDKLNFICVIDGQDVLAEVRSHI